MDRSIILNYSKVKIIIAIDERLQMFFQNLRIFIRVRRCLNNAKLVFALADIPVHNYKMMVFLDADCAKSVCSHEDHLDWVFFMSGKTMFSFYSRQCAWLLQQFLLELQCGSVNLVVLSIPTRCNFVFSRRLYHCLACHGQEKIGN